ncbi:MAG TPA: hypothetical protein VFK06_03220 [Candidatus Angelobacter sp.]|nr:hypothetical protein [Candidatus Angelobacter sp.]
MEGWGKSCWSFICLVVQKMSGNQGARLTDVHSDTIFLLGTKFIFKQACALAAFSRLLKKCLQKFRGRGILQKA